MTVRSTDGSVVQQDVLFEAMRGRVPGYARVIGRGYAPDVDTADVPCDVWSSKGAYTWLTGLTTLQILSSNAADAAAGAGARTVKVDGLDAAYLPITTTVTLNGVTPVTLPIQFFRVNLLTVMTVGASKVNVGDITLRVPGPGATIRHILAGHGVSTGCMYTVPHNRNLLILGAVATVSLPSAAAASAVLSAFIGSPANAIYQRTFVFTINAQGGPLSLPQSSLPLVSLPQHTDFSFQVLDVAANNTRVSCTWLGIELDTTITDV